MQVLEIPSIPKPYIMAHRGNSDRCPENTIAAFKQAIADGCDLIETDIHVTKDGVIVCIHDPSIDRTTDGSGLVREMTLDELQSFSASYGKEGFEEERVSTLDEVFAILPADMVLALELKTDDFLDPEVGRQLADQIEAAGRSERVVLLSFQTKRVQAVQSVALNIPTGFITMKRIIPKTGVQLLGPVWPILFLNPFYTLMAHLMGQPVAPLDPTPDGRLWYYKLLRCDAVLTNDPGKTKQRLGR